MKNIKILHLYSKALDLYGDYKNIDALVSRIYETGNTAEAETREHYEDIDFDAYDMVYIGHGRAKNLEAVREHFCSYADKIKSSVQNGKVFFVTGNARTLFGKEGIGLFDYTFVETNKVFVSDMVGTPVFDETETVYGFTNRTAHIEGENKYPLFYVKTGYGDGEKCNGTEGTLYKNFFGTWSMGPALIRNPVLMREILKRLLGEDYRDCDFSLEQHALDLVLKEFKENNNE